MRIKKHKCGFFTGVELKSDAVVIRKTDLEHVVAFNVIFRTDLNSVSALHKIILV